MSFLGGVVKKSYVIFERHPPNLQIDISIFSRRSDCLRGICYSPCLKLLMMEGHFISNKQGSIMSVKSSTREKNHIWNTGIFNYQICNVNNKIIDA